jgi:hypothetical protein
MKVNLKITKDMGKEKENGLIKMMCIAANGFKENSMGKELLKASTVLEGFIKMEEDKVMEN